MQAVIGLFWSNRSWPVRILTLIVAIVGYFTATTYQPERSGDCFAGCPKVAGGLTWASTHRLVNPGFSLMYSEIEKNPLWVAYAVTKPKPGASQERPDHFSVDKRTTAKVTAEDYRGTGYDRGHMAPNSVIAKVHGEDAQKATFLMSNISPQKPQLNQMIWQRLEMAEADYATMQGDGRLWVLVGPIMGRNPQALKSGVTIPEAFYRIWAVQKADGQIEVAGFIMPQTVCGTEQISKYRVSIDDIEKRTGLDFFPDLPDTQEATLEKLQFDPDWNWAAIDNLKNRYTPRSKPVAGCGG
jgi:endonuclease G